MVSRGCGASSKRSLSARIVDRERGSCSVPARVVAAASTPMRWRHAALGCVRRRKPVADRVPDRRATASSLSAASMTTQRSGSPAAMSRKVMRKAWWKASSSPSKRSRPERPPRRAPRAPARSRPADRESSVRSGRVSPTVTRSSARMKSRIEIAERSLIGARRIGETVADDECAGGERRPDRIVEMVDAGGGKRRAPPPPGRAALTPASSRCAQGFRRPANRRAHASRWPRSRAPRAARRDGGSASICRSLRRLQGDETSAFGSRWIIASRLNSSRHISGTGRSPVRNRHPWRAAAATRHRRLAPS